MYIYVYIYNHTDLAVASKTVQRSERPRQNRGRFGVCVVKYIFYILLPEEHIVRDDADDSPLKRFKSFLPERCAVKYLRHKQFKCQNVK